MKRVDIVVPSYNYADYLPGCIASLVSQQGVDVRVLIIDDASTDDTPTVASRLLSTYANLEYRRHASNAGHIATYNEGLLEWATAPYSLLFSADDLLAPGALARAAALMDEDEEIAMVCGFALLFESEPDIASAPQTGAPAEEPDARILPSAELLLRCVRGNPISTPTAVVRTRIQRLAGGYAPELPHSGDMEMWMRFALRGKLAMSRFVQAYKRLHPRNMSKDYQVLGDLRERLRAIEYACDRDAARLERYGLTREYARRSIAEEAVWTAHALTDSHARPLARACLQLALEIWPPVSRKKAWRRASFKFRLGPVWHRIRPLAQRLRQASPRDRLSADPLAGPRPGALQGWWPSGLSGANRHGLTPTPIPQGWVMEGSVSAAQTSLE
jgi:glycosyltransferase involved in cell wall biosynthesis